MSDKVYYRWRVTKAAPNDVWRSKGKVLRWMMDEESAAAHQAATGEELEKVPGSGETRAPVGQGYFPGLSNYDKPR